MAVIDDVDVVIAGGGAAGLALALALNVAAGSALKVAVCDPELARDRRGDSRAYAIVAGAIRFFDSIGAWQAMRDEAQPILRMEITDSRLEDLVRMPLLTFGAATQDEAPPAMMLANGTILAALMARARSAGLSLFSEPVSGFDQTGGRIAAIVGGRRLRARLLVIADGRGSRLRERAGIAYHGWRYPQTAIVGTIHHTLDHEGVAVQHFLPAGPFALLPLKGRRCSIVWNERPETVERLLRCDSDDLVTEIDRRAAGRFGTVTRVEGLASFPMSIGIARRFVGPRLALLGDAAHGFHPIAGQGLNYGLRGAAALAETIIDAARLGLDIGSETALGPYEAARRPDVMAMAAATETLNRLFSNDFGPLRAIRDLGLSLVDRLPGLGARFMQEAAGDSSRAPRAFRGLPI
ncbi:MAG TPA: FAD-dependent monooxygenase [Beijerinckiaceae bacterium]|nr:FAD-dependent monooxygenase [Beijerinckiaceae bacterium]